MTDIWMDRQMDGVIDRDTDVETGKGTDGATERRTNRGMDS